MLGPTSSLIIIVLLGVAGALLYAVARARHWVTKAVAGVGVILVAMSGGIIVVNDYFGYYTSWSDAYQGTFGGPSNPTTLAIDTRHAGVIQNESGKLFSIPLPGAKSHINRNGLMYLPPQYFLHRYRSVRFPVVELLHGTPGSPENWRYQMHIASTIDTALARRAIGPMVFVMPEISAPHPEQECLNYGNVRDGTYVSQDVPNDIRHRFRVSHDPAEWALAGYSSGGYCAANLALQHRRDFGAVASMDGYYWPSDGPAIHRLGANPAALSANDPLTEVQKLPDAAVPMPQFWISAGSGSSDDLHAARTFVAAIERLERVTFVVQPHAKHNFYAWRDQIPQALSWLWQAIAPPQLRVAFPTAGTAPTGTIRADKRSTDYRSPTHHPRANAPK